MDFYCPEIRLCIEVDGSVHDSNEAQHKDAERTAFLRDHGIRVIRFRNEEIEKDMDGVMLQIREIIDKQTGHHRYQKEENV